MTPAHAVVSREEWLRARIALLAREKEHTRQGDELARLRRELPWVRVEKEYRFDGPGGTVTLGELFRGRSQLIIYHFMFGADWPEGCPSCSYLTDHLEGALVHLEQRDVTLTMVSRAPFPRIEAFKQRMGWRLPWVSSHGTDFNVDSHVAPSDAERARGKAFYNYALQDSGFDELHGLSVFHRDAHGGLFHTYSTFARGAEPLVTTYALLDLVPKGRDEAGLAFPMAWVRHHDRYGDGYAVDRDAGYRPPVPIALPRAR
jgi:predicted dithiol-disulfide oxidoreductase (DUF899 family)